MPLGKTILFSDMDVMIANTAQSQQYDGGGGDAEKKTIEKWEKIDEKER